MKIIGITGGVGAGKTQILEYLNNKYGATICMADEVGKKLQKKGTECFDEIVGDRKKELEEEQILKILRKKNYDPEQWTFEEKQRLMASLYRKGFSSELIHVHFYLT